MSRPALTWRCDNPVHGVNGVTYAARPPKGRCWTCNRRCKPRAVGLQCRSCGQIQKLSPVGKPCVWCGGELRFYSEPQP